jgi:MFS family permease
MSVVEVGRPIAPGMPIRLLAINALGLYAMLMYGITYYAITTAAPRMAAEFGYPGSSIFAILTVSLLMTAALAPRLGRLTDRIGASSILLGGALLRSALLAGMALSPEPVTFAIALLLVQILGQVTEYDATFAAAVELAGDRARSGMSQITLWGGLASTAFWPATAFLLEKMSWRAMFLVYAAVILGVCVPIAAYIRSVANPGRTSRAPAVMVRPDATEMAPSNHTLRSTPPFWLLAAAFALGGVTYNLPSLMLPVLDGLGLGASAVMVGMIFGPAQTAGRFVDMLAGDRVRAITVAVIASTMVAIAFAVLLAGGVWAGMAFAVLFGAGAGVGYVVRGSVVLAFYGPLGYATWLGRLGTVRLVVTALSPLGLSLILERLGALAVVHLCGIAALLSLACFVVLAARMREREISASSP